MKISVTRKFCDGPASHERGGSRLHDCDYLVVEAVGMNRVVQSLQKFCSLPRHKIGARNLPFLQGLIRIEQIAQQISFAG